MISMAGISLSIVATDTKDYSADAELFGTGTSPTDQKVQCLVLKTKA